MNVAGHTIETLSPPALDTQTAMLLESSNVRKGVARGDGSHRRSLSISGSIDLSVQSDASAAAIGADAADHTKTYTAESRHAAAAGAMELRALAEVGSSVADVAVEAAVNYVAATSAFAPQLARYEQLLSAASCSTVQAPTLPSNHVTPLVNLQLPVTVQEFFLCFIGDDHQFNTKVTLPLFGSSVGQSIILLNIHCTMLLILRVSVPCCTGQLQHLQYTMASRTVIIDG